VKTLYGFDAVRYIVARTICAAFGHRHRLIACQRCGDNLFRPLIERFGLSLTSEYRTPDQAGHMPVAASYHGSRYAGSQHFATLTRPYLGDDRANGGATG